MEKELRKRQDVLVNAGIGMIMFGLWGVAKINMYLAMSSVFAEAYRIAIQESTTDAVFLKVGFWIFMAVFLVFSLFFRLYIGLSAVAEGRGRKKGYTYILLTVALLIFNLQTNWYVYYTNFQQIDIYSVVGFFVEMTSLYVLLELLINAICVKRLRKKMKR